MLKHVIRGTSLALLTSIFVFAVGPAAQAKDDNPKSIVEIADGINCGPLTAYEPGKPAKAAADCFLKGKGKKLGYFKNGHAGILLFKSKAAGTAFWAGYLTDCGGDCYLVRKDKLWYGGAGYDKDIAEYVKGLVGGKIKHY
jgi:hypothetical protein